MALSGLYYDFLLTRTYTNDGTWTSEREVSLKWSIEVTAIPSTAVTYDLTSTAPSQSYPLSYKEFKLNCPEQFSFGVFTVRDTTTGLVVPECTVSYDLTM